MDTLLYAQFLDSIKFSNETKVEYYDTRQDGIRRGWLSDAELEAVIPQMALPRDGNSISIGDTESTCKILIFSGMGANDIQPLQTRKSTLTRIMETCEFPSSFVQTVCGNNGHFAQFIEYYEDNPAYLSIVLRFPYSPIRSVACTLRVRLSDRATSGLIFAEGYLSSSREQEHINALFARFHARRFNFRKSPLQLICTLAEEYGRNTELWRAKLDYDILQIEQLIGKTDFNVDPLKRVPRSSRKFRSLAPPRPDGDLEDIIQDLHTVNTHLIWLDCVTNFELELNKFGHYLVGLCEDLRRTRGEPRLAISDRTTLEDESRYHFNECNFKRYQCTGLQRRAKTQINLIYSETSQRDSRVNLSVAEDSRQISSAALLDSRAMRTIAVVTLLFLPPSLIASVYDAGIIDVGPKSIHVSKFWWTYFTSSVGLTSLVFAVWIIYMRVSKGKPTRPVYEMDVEKGK
jgi:hypothetical protein